MKSFLKHWGLLIGGGACVTVAVLFPPVAPVLGPIGTKLILLGGGGTALAAASPGIIRQSVVAMKAAVTKPKAP